MKLIFRDLKQQDKAEFIKILKATKFFNKEEISIAIELIDDYLQKQQASDYRFLIAVEQNQHNQVVGYTCFGHIMGTTNNYDLYWIVVAPAVQNQGIGKQLLLKTEQIIFKLGGDKLYTETSGRRQYLSTRQFYINNGFILEATLKDFYAPLDDKLIFSKNLSSVGPHK